MKLSHTTLKIVYNTEVSMSISLGAVFELNLFLNWNNKVAFQCIKMRVNYLKPLSIIIIDSL